MHKCLPNHSQSNCILCAHYAVKRHSSSKLPQIKTYTQPDTLFHYFLDQEHGNSPESEVNVEMQKCGAYEVVLLSRQRVTMKDNPV